MMNLLKDILSSDVGSGVFVASIIALIFAAGRFWTLFSIHQKELDKVKDDVKKMPTIDANHTQFEKRVDKIEGTLTDMRSDIMEIKVALKTTSSTPLTQSNSPISLSDRGREFAEKHRAEEIVDKHWTQISQLLKAIDSENPYDIQNYIFKDVSIRLEDYFGKEQVDKLKIIAYNEGLDLFSISRLLGVIIRDRYFAENNIDTSLLD